MRSVHKTYSNGEITVHWRSELCCHSAICITRLPQVFSLSRSPWINMQGASTEKIKEIVELCPTCALSWELDGGNMEK